MLDWNTDVFPLTGKHPTSALDLFNTTDFPGKRCLFNFPKWSGNLEFALMADGVAWKDVYKTLATPDGLKRAFNKLDTIRDDIVWVDSGANSISTSSTDSVTSGSHGVVGRR